MKKRRIAAVVLVFSLMLANTAYAQGRINGMVLKSDIKAYINGEPIMTYNIDGYTGVIAEDLRNYGFDVEWRADSRTLYVTRDYDDNEINEVPADEGVPSAGRGPDRAVHQR